MLEAVKKVNSYIKVRESMIVDYSQCLK